MYERTIMTNLLIDRDVVYMQETGSFHLPVGRHLDAGSSIVNIKEVLDHEGLRNKDENYS